MRQQGFPWYRSSPEANNWKASNQVDRAWYQVCGDRWHEEPRVWICKVKSIRQMEQGNTRARKKQYLEFLMLGKQYIGIISKRNCEKVNPRQMLEDFNFLKIECSSLRKAESLLILQFNIRSQSYSYLLLNAYCVPNYECFLYLLFYILPKFIRYTLSGSHCICNDQDRAVQ